MQVLFIARVDGSKKPLVDYISFAQEASDTIQQTEVTERNSETETSKHALKLTQARLSSIVKRPTRSGSKVYISGALLSINHSMACKIW